MAVSLAPTPLLDVALMVLQNEILERIEVLAALGDVDLAELEELAARADEYRVMCDSGRIPVCPDTRTKIDINCQKCLAAIRNYRFEAREKAREIENEQ